MVTKNNIQKRERGKWHDLLHISVLTKSLVANAPDKPSSSFLAVASPLLLKARYSTITDKLQHG
jgi:hypothetical protein